MRLPYLGRVVESRPAWRLRYLESLTDEIARAAWAVFQKIEGAGGVAEALASGWIATEAERARAERQAALTEGKTKLVGVTVFPNPAEAPVQVETPDAAAFAVEAPSARLPGPDASCPPLTPSRTAAPFEEASK